MLDNGAAEDLGIGPRHLLTLAEQAGVDEIVLPDTLGDAVDTISKVMAFTPYYKPDFQYMAVVQGQSLSDVYRCLGFYDGNNPAVLPITTLGIPRLLNNIHKHFRYQLAEWLVEQQFHLKFDIHFLGAHHHFVDEVAVLSEFDVFRGIDTSMPISYGLQSVSINDAGFKYYPRPRDYFELTYTNRLVDQNVDTYLDWAKYEQASAS